MKRTGDLKLMQELNRSIILETIRKHGPISRSDIAKMNRISPTTVTTAVNEMISDKLLFEEGLGSSSGGRKPILVRFHAESRYIIGVSIKDTFVRIAEMNLNAEVKVKKTYLYPKGVSGDKIIHFIVDSLTDFVKTCRPPEYCLGVSIIAPAIVDATKGEIRYWANKQLRNVPLKDIVEGKTGLKTWVDKDVNAIVLAEKDFGSYAHIENILYVEVNEGVGVGIVVNNDLLRGFHKGAGEFGHMSIMFNGEPCSCGSKGCLEKYAGWPSIENQIMQPLHSGRHSLLKMDPDKRMTPKQWIEAIGLSDPLAVEIAETVSTSLAMGIINLIHLLNPQVVILGGEILKDNEYVFKRVEEIVMHEALNLLTQDLRISRSSLGDDIELIASASLLLRDAFQSPRMVT